MDSNNLPYETKKRFAELTGREQLIMSRIMCIALKARKAHVIQRIFLVANPEMVLTYDKDGNITKFCVENEQSQRVVEIALRQYIKEAL